MKFYFEFLSSSPIIIYIDYYYFVVNTHYKRDVQLFFTTFFHNMIKWQVMIRTSFWHELIIDITCKKIKIIKIMNLVPCLLKAWARARHCSWKNAGTTNYTIFSHNSPHSKLWVEKKKKGWWINVNPSLCYPQLAT